MPSRARVMESRETVVLALAKVVLRRTESRLLLSLIQSTDWLMSRPVQSEHCMVLAAGIGKDQKAYIKRVIACTDIERCIARKTGPDSSKRNTNET